MGETDEAALAVAAAVDERVRADLSTRRTRALAGAGVAAIGLLVGGYLLWSGPALFGAVFLACALAGAGTTYYYVEASDPSVEVVGARKRYWSVGLLPGEGGTVIYDVADAVDRTELELERLDDMTPFESARSKFEGDDDLPVVMDEEANVEGEYRETLEGVVEAFDAVEPHRVDAPLLAASSPTARSVARLSEHATDSDGPRGRVDVPLDSAAEDVELIHELEQLAFEDDAETELRRMSGDARDRVTDVLDAQEHAVRTLNGHIRSVGDTLAVANYRFYCPVCALDDIDAELTSTDHSADTWHCSTCRNDIPTGAAIPRHRLRDELVLDIVDQLWVEKDDERRQVYENIEDQQSELVEREYEQAREEIRDTWNRIKDIRSKIRDLETEAVAGAGAIEDIGNLMVKYDRLRRERLQKFETDVEEAREEIQRQADEIIEQTREIEDEKREEAFEEAQERDRLEKEEQLRQDYEQLAMQAELFGQLDEDIRAQSGMQAAMLGQIDEDVRELTEEQRKAHMEERLLETEGGLHMFDTVNRYRDAKGRVFGRSKVGVE